MRARVTQNLSIVGVIKGMSNACSAGISWKVVLTYFLNAVSVIESGIFLWQDVELPILLKIFERSYVWLTLACCSGVRVGRPGLLAFIFNTPLKLMGWSNLQFDTKTNNLAIFRLNLAINHLGRLDLAVKTPSGGCVSP
jgi:hypothetical protein